MVGDRKGLALTVFESVTVEFAGFESTLVETTDVELLLEFFPNFLPKRPVLSGTGSITGRL